METNKGQATVLFISTLISLDIWTNTFVSAQQIRRMVVNQRSKEDE